MGRVKNYYWEQIINQDQMAFYIADEEKREPMKTRQSSQAQLIFQHLKRGYAITPLEALNKFGCFRLAAVIHTLRKKGHHITTDFVVKGDKHFARYKLKQ